MLFSRYVKYVSHLPLPTRLDIGKNRLGYHGISSRGQLLFGCSRTPPLGGPYHQYQDTQCLKRSFRCSCNRCYDVNEPINISCEDERIRSYLYQAHTVPSSGPNEEIECHWEMISGCALRRLCEKYPWII